MRADGFSTDLRAHDGVWPAAPSRMSYSTLKELERCPRRWMLSRASYPDIWSRAGYPEMPALPALVGTLVHKAIEVIVGGMLREGCRSTQDPSAVDVLRKLGGYTVLVSNLTDELLGGMSENPRAAGRAASLRDSLRGRIPDIRQRVQTAISRTTLEPSVVGDARPDGGQAQRWALGPGSYPEIEVRDDDMGWKGVIDLLTVRADGCEITDFKSGAEDETHADQVRIYALLWSKDRVLNPNGLPSTQLIIRYPSQDVSVGTLSAEENVTLESGLRQRTAAAALAILGRPPEARPSADLCGTCSVRHMCDAYWAFLETAPGQPVIADEVVYGDVEVLIQKRNGPRSWAAKIARGSIEADQVVLRANVEGLDLEFGSRLRLLNIALDEGIDGGQPLLTMLAGSESFELRDH